jgi:signal transduction histidine kinase
MLQETLTNVARHAAATWVEITLEVREDVLTLRVADNGRGISMAERTDPHSLGLVGLRERAIACAGDLVIEGRPGEGTTLTVRIPLPLAAAVP